MILLRESDNMKHIKLIRFYKKNFLGCKSTQKSIMHLFLINCSNVQENLLIDQDLKNYQLIICNYSAQYEKGMNFVRKCEYLCLLKILLILHHIDFDNLPISSSDCYFLILSLTLHFWSILYWPLKYTENI
jgi:hypothetical protein